MIVCIAEKPSVARDIARILGATKSCEGYLEGNGYQVTWTFGHLCELKYPEDYTETWKRWTLGQLPMIPARFGIRLKDDSGIKKQFATIKQLFEKAELIINCGDAGQEGELIQRWVKQQSGATCPVKRLWISSMTDEAIREGFENLQTEQKYDGLYQAGLCRAIGDWILGMNATRLYTLKYGRRERGATPLSVGRVQTPTLALIVRRQQEIDQFVPTPYWVLATEYRQVLFTAQVDSDGDAQASRATRNAFLSEDEAKDALRQIEGKPFEVVSVQQKNGSEAPPRLFDLTSLQVECNKKFGFSAEQTLQLVQSLYEKKITTYPRVDTTYLPDDVYPRCAQMLNGLNEYYEPLLLPLRGKKLKKSGKVFDTKKVTDHHAIIPTGHKPNNLTDMERKVFDLVARRFIAIFHDDCLFSTTTVTGRIEKTDFRATGKQILQPGWRVVFEKEKAQTDEDEAETKDEERVLPAFNKGESGPHKPTLTQKQTQPPKPYTEATLLRAMETAGRQVDDEDLRDALKDNGIGRPSTRAAIIETLFRRRYIVKAKKALMPTATGTDLIAIIKEELLKSVELTGQWERKLREIERGTYDAATFIGEMKDMVQQIVNEVLSDNSQRIIENAPAPQPKRAARKPDSTPAAKRIRVGSKCPVCGEGKVIKGNTAYGCSRWREGCTFRQPFAAKTAKSRKKQA
ncbi:MAG: DNA topoisomerase 3 [Alloprevotella sp.]|nr:DNA topoisomerase 3 [Alloprevotella sp.]